MQDQNAAYQRDKSPLEIMAMARASSCLENAREMVDPENYKSANDLNRELALHATLQQRERHHIELIECLNVGINEISARLKEGCLELDLLTQEVSGVKSEINRLQLELAGISESIDFANTLPLTHWVRSDEAAISKAKEIGIDIRPEWSMDDLRYKLDLVINGAHENENFQAATEIETSLIESVLTKHYLDNLTEEPSEIERSVAIARIERIARGG